MAALPNRTLRSLVEDRSTRYPDIIMDEIPRSFPGPFELPRFPRGETKPGLPGIFDTIPIPGRRRKQTREECQRAVRESGVMHIMDPCQDLLPGGSNPFPDMDPTLPGRLPDMEQFPDMDPTLPVRRPDREQFPSLPTGPSVGEAVAGTAGYFLGKFLKDKFKL